MPATMLDGYNLLHDGVLALAEIESNGIRIDVPYVEKQMERTGKKIDILNEQFWDTELGIYWKKVYKRNIDMDSDDQLRDILYQRMNLKPTKETDTGLPSVDAEALLSLEADGIDELLEIRKLNKVRGTYLKNILGETVDGYLHPQFNLHLVRTYRSSSDSPNFQNLPIRDKEMGRTIRRCFIPRPGHYFVEVDYSGLEVRIAACYHKDKRMIEYIKDPSKDMHRDMAAQIFMVPINKVTKDARYVAKNRYVFPAFYGSYYKQMAPDLWAGITELKLENGDGVPLKKHLASKGISSYKQFEEHIRRIDDDFWGVRFKQYAQWKEDWYQDYLDKGYFDTLTGFRISGEMKRNDVTNYPVQGAAFHCLLNSVIQIHEYLKGMRSKVVGQIHDSCVMDVHESELQKVLDYVDFVMCRKVPREWNWIIVPLDAEVEVAPLNKSWHEKEEWIRTDGVWHPKK